MMKEIVHLKNQLLCSKKTAIDAINRQHVWANLSSEFKDLLESTKVSEVAIQAKANEYLQLEMNANTLLTKQRISQRSFEEDVIHKSKEFHSQESEIYKVAVATQINIVEQKHQLAMSKASLDHNNALENLRQMEVRLLAIADKKLKSEYLIRVKERRISAEKTIQTTKNIELLESALNKSEAECKRRRERGKDRYCTYRNEMSRLHEDIELLKMKNGSCQLEEKSLQLSLVQGKKNISAITIENGILKESIENMRKYIKEKEAEVKDASIQAHEANDQALDFISQANSAAEVLQQKTADAERRLELLEIEFNKEKERIYESAEHVETQLKIQYKEAMRESSELQTSLQSALQQRDSALASKLDVENNLINNSLLHKQCILELTENYHKSETNALKRLTEEFHAANLKCNAKHKETLMNEVQREKERMYHTLVNEENTHKIKYLELVASNKKETNEKRKIVQCELEDENELCKREVTSVMSRMNEYREEIQKIEHKHHSVIEQNNIEHSKHLEQIEAIQNENNNKLKKQIDQLMINHNKEVEELTEAHTIESIETHEKNLELNTNNLKELRQENENNYEKYLIQINDENELCKREVNSVMSRMNEYMEEIQKIENKHHSVIEQNNIEHSKHLEQIEAIQN
eukprot:GSMAST32.ASY1.ANO1.95.1 assembled CDS